MTIVETAKITSKGQVTIPNKVRKILHLKEGATVAFGIDEHGVVIMPCKITTESPYTAKEWAKIEKLAASEGKTYKSIQEAKKHIQSL